MRRPLLRLAATLTPWGKHGTPNSHWGAISTGSALWRFTPSSRFSSPLQRTTRSRCGICRRRLLPKSKNVSKQCLSNSTQALTHRFLLARSRRVLDMYWFPVRPFMFCSVRYVNTQSALCSVQALYTWRSRPSTIREKSSLINESHKEDSLHLLPNCHTIQPHETLPVRQRADNNLLHSSHDVISRLCSPHAVWSHVMGLFLEPVSRLL